MRIKNKCHKCTDRKLGCHTYCEDYKEFVSYLARIKEIERKENVVMYYNAASCDMCFRQYRVKKKFMKR